MAGSTTPTRRSAPAPIRWKSTNPACASCHKAIDGIGFTFENYDSLGRWRDLDNGYPVDATGSSGLDGESVDYDGAIELGQVAANSHQVHACYVAHMLEYAAQLQLLPMAGPAPAP